METTGMKYLFAIIDQLPSAFCRNLMLTEFLTLSYRDYTKTPRSIIDRSQNSPGIFYVKPGRVRGARIFNTGTKFNRGDQSASRLGPDICRVCLFPIGWILYSGIITHSGQGCVARHQSLVWTLNSLIARIKGGKKCTSVLIAGNRQSLRFEKRYWARVFLSSASPAEKA
jgi:hypothetical protein